MSYGQGGPPSQWDPWKPQSQQPWSGGDDNSQSPDWAALAEASETRHKRRRLLLIGGGAIATVAIGTAVAVAVVSANGSNQAAGGPSSQAPATADLPSPSGATPSFAPTSAPPPLDPKDFVSNVKKDRAPLAPDVLFPGTQLTMGETVYKKGPTADTRDCASAAKATLPKVLTDNGCSRLLRVTYTKDDVAVTVGVAVFDTEAQAAKAKQQADTRSIIKSLAGGGVKEFCDGAVCRSTTNSYGRYAYFTLSGFTSVKDVTEQDKAVFSTGDDLAEFTFRQIRRRGEAQASAAANE
ncbi:hypothetical protein ACFYY3_17370 [Streptomyces sp. NPDC001812]|uniref:Tat pathway signal protein n=1 Tax=Streptomyces cathayae TaxID=3031124 RepID=A0ABY8K3E7_9ACTN|nr:hypothetical protein [Streptomyces sp. HUAS 5]WGD41305.1 hypothetical protein PYS65_14670 [Streptomyces sp. HUAS 5]